MEIPIHVEVVQRNESAASAGAVRQMVLSFLSNLVSLSPGAVLGEAQLAESALGEHVQCVTLCDAGHAEGWEVRAADACLVVHVHRLDARGVESDMPADGEAAPACEVRALPSAELHGLWESLVFDTSLKADTLRFVETAFEFEARGVDARVVAWNRMLLLHGPPGTGKTSLCRALAHKLAVRLADRFPRARLLEINAHGLFSKWFSESGKLVTKLFDRIQEIVDDPRLLACVLIDEVESLTHARRAALAGLEPSDSIRAVNAVLTALDRLRRRPNALVLTTSNVTGAIDGAFVDRADLRRRVGPPGEGAAYAILRSCCEELMTRGVVAPREHLFALRELKNSLFEESESSQASVQLVRVARAAVAGAVSARALRRLPFLAAALHCPPAPPAAPPTLPRFLAALQAALDQHLRDEDELEHAPPAPARTPLHNGH